MKKIIFILSIAVYSCNFDNYLYPSINMSDFPYNIEPFNSKTELMIDCENDPLCGTYKYFSGDSEKGLVEVFKYQDVYYLHYFRDDKAEYIGIGIEKHGHFAVNYYYPNCTDFGVAHYIFDGKNFTEGKWSSFNTPGKLIDEGTTEKLIKNN